MNESEALPAEAWIIATLKEILEVQKITNQRLSDVQNELSSIRNAQKKSDIHLKFRVNLSIEHTNEEIIDFIKEGLEIDSVYVMPVPSPISLKFRGIDDETIDLNVGDDYSLSGHVVTQIFITNSAGSGEAIIHVYGRRK